MLPFERFALGCQFVDLTLEPGNLLLRGLSLQPPLYKVKKPNSELYRPVRMCFRLVDLALAPLAEASWAS